jgi:L-arabinose transport system substrate-binding protein
MKLMTVDDRLVGSDNEPMKDVHHVGIQAYDIGKSVGQAISDEAKERGWNMAEVGAIVLTLDKLETATQRINGAVEVLRANGMTEANLIRSPWKGDVPDTKGAIDAANIALTQHPEFKKWVAIASNDDGVLGCIRASEGRGIKSEDMIGVGINGNEPAIADLKRNPPTGFFGTILLSAKQHGYETLEAMYHWIKDGKEPELETWTSGMLMTRENYEQVLKEQGL